MLHLPILLNLPAYKPIILLDPYKKFLRYRRRAIRLGAALLPLKLLSSSLVSPDIAEGAGAGAGVIGVGIGVESRVGIDIGADVGFRVGVMNVLCAAMVEQ